MTELIDTRLGQYQLTEVVGRGGMAVVYKAYQPSLDRFVAIKLLSHTNDPQFAERFKLEARMIANVQHPHILPIYDYGEQQGMLYLVLQYIENGASLADTLGAPMEPAPTLRLMARVLDALGYAHERGIIHRDIKPSNILLLSPRWPMLADFGIAKLMSDDQRLTMSGMIVGTAAYMAPEQATGRTVDARTDLYAAGIVLYELLTGRVPFEADTPMAVLIKHSYEAPPPPRSLNPSLPEAVEVALLRALAKDPADRYQSAAEMAEALEQVAVEIEHAPARDQRADLYQAGLQASEAGRWETAIEQFERLVVLDPAYADAARRLDAARKQQETAEQQDLRATLYQAGVRAFQAGRWETAIEQFERLMVLDPEYEDAPRWLDNARKAQTYSQQQAVRTGAGEAVQAAPEGVSKPAAPATPRPATASQPSRARWPLWVGALIALALLGAGALWLARGRGAGPLTPTAAPTAAVIAVATALPSPAPPASPVVGAGATAVPASSPAPVVTPIAAPSPTSAAPLSPTPLPTALVDAASVIVRAGPSESFRSLGQYDRGTVFYVIGKTPTGDWLQVLTLDEQVGWVLAADLQLNADLATIPVAQVPPTPTP